MMNGQHWSDVREVPRTERAWLDHLNCDQETRTALMEEWYAAIAAMGEGDRERATESIIREELGSDDQEYRRLTAAQLRAWIRLAGHDSEAVRRVGDCFDAVFATLGTSEFRRAVAVQSVAAVELSDDEERLLLRLVPGTARFLSPAKRPD